jgi:hypothetical protein
MSFVLTYKPLFKVRFNHLFFQSLGDKTLDELSPKEKKMIEEKFNAQVFFEVTPSAESLKWLDGHKMVFKPAPFGFIVFMKADPHNTAKPMIDPQGLKLIFQIRLTDSAFNNYTALPLKGNFGKIYFFSNEQMDNPPALSLKYSEFQQGQDYEMDNLVTFSGNSYMAAAGLVQAAKNPDEADSGWILIDKDDFVSSANRTISINFKHVFSSSEPSVILRVSDLDGAELVTETMKGDQNSEFTLDLSHLASGRYHFSARKANNDLISGFDFYLINNMANPWGIIEIAITSGNNPFDILDNAGSFKDGLMYELNFKNRRTVWRYISNEDKSVLLETDPLPLSRNGYINIAIDGENVPNADSRLIKPETGQVVSEIFVD